MRRQLLCLRGLDELLDPVCVLLAVTVARNRVRPAGTFGQDVRPEEPGLDMHRSNFLEGDGHLIRREPAWLLTDDSGGGHLDDGRKEKVSGRPPARRESLDA